MKFIIYWKSQTYPPNSSFPHFSLSPLCYSLPTFILKVLPCYFHPFRPLLTLSADSIPCFFSSPLHTESQRIIQMHCLSVVIAATLMVRITVQISHSAVPGVSAQDILAESIKDWIWIQYRLGIAVSFIKTKLRSSRIFRSSKEMSRWGRQTNQAPRAARIDLSIGGSWLWFPLPSVFCLLQYIISTSTLRPKTPPSLHLAWLTQTELPVFCSLLNPERKQENTGSITNPAYIKSSF